MRHRASLLAHRGHGTFHFDLIIEAGAHCHALQLEPRGTGWRLRWLPPHRRRYLAFSGPIGGRRGAVSIIWKGSLQIRRIASASDALSATFDPPGPGSVRVEKVVLTGWPLRMPR